MTPPHVLYARLDSLGDVLLQGPAIRAVASRAGRVTMLCSPQGRAAAELLPGIDDVVVWRAPWIDAEPQPVRRVDVDHLVDRLASMNIDQAVVSTSFHQSPLPTALLLRLAGVATIAAISEDYPGSLLDVRHWVADDVHEVERARSLVAALGYHLPPGDAGGLAVRRRHRAPRPFAGPYVVVHPGASVPARAWFPDRNAALVDALAGRGVNVAVTGAPSEAPLTALVAGPPRERVADLGGRLPFPELADVLAAADVVVTGNTGPAHLAAAVGTPVVSLFAPTVPAARWRPWAVPTVLLGRHDIACAGCRARVCPIEGQPCLAAVTVDDVLAAVDHLRHERQLGPRPVPPVRQRAQPTLP